MSVVKGTIGGGEGWKKLNVCDDIRQKDVKGLGHWCTGPTNWQNTM